MPRGGMTEGENIFNVRLNQKERNRSAFVRRAPVLLKKTVALRGCDLRKLHPLLRLPSCFLSGQTDRDDTEWWSLSCDTQLRD